MLAYPVSNTVLTDISYAEINYALVIQEPLGLKYISSAVNANHTTLTTTSVVVGWVCVIAQAVSEA